MRWQSFLIDPTVHGVARNPEVSHDFLDRKPPFTDRSRLIPGLILHEAAIISNSRNREKRLGIALGWVPWHVRSVQPAAEQPLSLHLYRRPDCLPAPMHISILSST
jgi:hypothetical protein